MTESELRFHLEEYKELRKEVLDKMTKTENLLQYSVLIAAAVYSWLATRDPAVQLGAASTKISITMNPLARLAWWIPFAAAVIIGMIGLAQYTRIKEMGEYLRHLEDAMGNSQLGWEKHLSRQRYTVSPAFVIAWLTILLGTAAVGLFVR